MGGGSYGSAFIVLGMVCAVAGWALIEFVLWIFSFVHITFG